MRRPFKLFILLIILTLIAHAERRTLAQPKTKVATVGNTHIYLDQIQLPEEVRAQLQHDGARIRAQEKTTLRHLIRQAILAQQIQQRSISTSPKVVDKQALALANRAWEALGATEAAREKVLEKNQYRMTKLREALLLWKLDNERGDRFAQRELEPLGISQSNWKQLTSRINDPELWKGIEQAIAYDRDALLSVYRQEAKSTAEHELLQRAVIPNVTVSDAEVRRLFELTEQLDWIELVIITADQDTLLDLKDQLEQQREHALEAISEQYGRRRLSGRLLKLGESNALYGAYLLILATHCESLDPGEVSSLYQGYASDGRLLDWLLYIVGKEMKEDSPELTETSRAELRTAIESFKREEAFNKWLWSQMVQQTVIHMSEFQEIFAGKHQP